MNTFNIFGDVIVQHQHIGHTHIDPLFVPDINNPPNPPPPAAAAMPDVCVPMPAPNPNVIPLVNLAPRVEPDVAAAVELDAAPAVELNADPVIELDVALVVEANAAPAVGPDAPAVVDALAVLPGINNGLAIAAREPLPEPRHARRARRGPHADSPFLCDNPDFWRKIRTLPHHLRFIFLSGCDLWDFRVLKEMLRLVILHFLPGLYIPQKTCKPEYIRLFHDCVLAPYGARYRLQR